MLSLKKIRVLETIRQGKIGGGESHVLNLVQVLDKNQFDVVILSFTEGPMVQWFVENGFETHVIKTETAFDLSVITKVKKILSDGQVSIIHAHGTRACSNVFFAAKILKIPILYTIHGWSFHDDQSFLVHALRVLSEKFLCARVACNVTVSQGNKEAMLRHYPKFRSIHVNYGIDLTRFNATNTFKEVRATYKIPHKAFVIGYIVRMTKQKDPLTMVRAFNEFAKEKEDVRLLMIGEGELQSAAADLVRSLGLSDKVAMDKFTQDVPDVLNAIDVFCLPSLWEGLPIGLLEAMAMAKPVVATSVDGSREIIKDRINGLLVPVSSPALLAEALMSLYNDRNFMNRIGMNAARTIKETYDRHAMAAKIALVYKDLNATRSQL